MQLDRADRARKAIVSRAKARADRVLSMAEREIGIRETREQTVRTSVEGQFRAETTLAEADRDSLRRGQYLAAGISSLVAGLSFAGMFLTPWAVIGFAVPLSQVAVALVRTISEGRQRQPHHGAEPEQE